MVVHGCGADSGVPGENGGGAEGMVAGAFPGSGSYCCGSACDVGAAAFCRVSSAVSGGGDPEWNGDKGVFAGAVFCAAAGGADGFRGGYSGRCGYTAV